MAKIQILHKCIAEKLFKDYFKMATADILIQMDRLIDEAPTKRIARTVTAMQKSIENSTKYGDEGQVLLQLSEYYEALYETQRYQEKYK